MALARVFKIFSHRQTDTDTHTHTTDHSTPAQARGNNAIWMVKIVLTSEVAFRSVSFRFVPGSSVSRFTTTLRPGERGRVGKPCDNSSFSLQGHKLETLDAILDLLR